MAICTLSLKTSVETCLIRGSRLMQSHGTSTQELRWPTSDCGRYRSARPYSSTALFKTNSDNARSNHRSWLQSRIHPPACSTSITSGQRQHVPIRSFSKKPRPQTKPVPELEPKSKAKASPPRFGPKKMFADFDREVMSKPLSDIPPWMRSLAMTAAKYKEQNDEIDKQLLRDGATQGTIDVLDWVAYLSFVVVATAALGGGAWGIWRGWKLMNGTEDVNDGKDAEKGIL